MATAIVELLRQHAMERPDQHAYVLLVDGEVGEADLHMCISTTGRGPSPRCPGVSPVLSLSPPGLDYIMTFHRFSRTV